MPVTLSYPGVYIQEIPSGSRAITGVATAVAAFVGRASRGPVDEPVAITSYAEFARIFGGLSPDSGLGHAVRDYYVNGGNQAVIVRLAAGATKAKLAVDALTLEAVGPGSWGKALQAEVRYPADDDAKLVAEQQGIDNPSALFHLTVREGTAEEPRVVETYPNVTLIDGPRRIDAVLQASQLVRVAQPFKPPAGPPGPGRPDELSPDKPKANETAYDKTTGGNDDSGELKVAQYDDTKLDAANRGIYALRRADIFTLLCLPPAPPDGTVPDAVWKSALALCVDERALLVVDPPANADVAAISTWASSNGLTAQGRNAALYFPRMRTPDPLREGALGAFAPSGAVAGVMARTDGARGVWKAPAGIEGGLVGVSGTDVPLTDGENGKLNPVGVNCLRTFPTIGTVVWGARTLRGADLLADEYKYVPVRRLALFLEETLYRNTQWVVFEPNDEPLWSQIRASIGAFMQDLFRQGAFQGTTPRDAYFVHCNSETTTQYDIDRGIVNIIVGFAPLKPAEFVVVSIQQKAATAQA